MIYIRSLQARSRRPLALQVDGAPSLKVQQLIQALDRRLTMENAVDAITTAVQRCKAEWERCNKEVADLTDISEWLKAHDLAAKAKENGSADATYGKLLSRVENRDRVMRLVAQWLPMKKSYERAREKHAEAHRKGVSALVSTLCLRRHVCALTCSHKPAYRKRQKLK